MLDARARRPSTWEVLLRGLAAPDSRGSDWQPSALLFAALLGAVLFRIYLLIANDFPVNDGALFVEFVRAAAATFPSLPNHVEYNGLVLPFAYPPLSFWIGALLTKLGFDSLAVVRVLPILLNIGYVLLFAALLLKSGRSRLFTALAILFFAVNLRSFEWLLMGGGLTRGLGAVFLLLSLLAVGIPERGRPRLGLLRLVLTGAAVAGAILSHLEWGILAAASVVLSRALGSLNVRDFIMSCAIAGATASALVLPWLLYVVDAQGFEPFLAASTSSGWQLGFVKGRMLLVALAAVASNPLAVLGGIVLLIRRQWFWTGFILLCVVLTPRHAQSPAMLAVAVFGAQGIISAFELAGCLVRSRTLLQGSAVLMVTALLAANLYRGVFHAPAAFRVLPQEMRHAMSWAEANAPGRSFAIINDRPWPNDSTGEWLPTLTSSQSVTTVQGREWNGQFAQWEDMTKALRTSESCTELHSKLKPFGRFDLVWAETKQECFTAPSYRPLFRNELVVIYRPALPEN